MRACSCSWCSLTFLPLSFDADAPGPGGRGHGPGPVAPSRGGRTSSIGLAPKLSLWVPQPCECALALVALPLLALLGVDPHGRGTLHAGEPIACQLGVRDGVLDPLGVL